LRREIADRAGQRFRRRESERHGVLASREVLWWAAEGKSAQEIGEILQIAKRTVDEHTQKAIRKLGAANRTQAVATVLRKKLIGKAPVSALARRHIDTPS
jgi:DNA-binding CsgD family transcriptional regulator